jgi:GNAT superfamily N-acetyltransferase
VCFAVEHEIQPLHRLIQLPAAVQLAVRGWLEMEERGYGSGRNVPPFTSDSQALAAIVANGQEKMVGGVITFTTDQALSRLWIDMSYVMPEFRGTGVYRSMWEALVRIAVANNFATIESATSMRNAPMRAVAKKMHRVEEAVYLVYKVMP